VDYSLQHFGPGISADAVKNLLGRLDRNEFYDQEQSQVNDYQMSEDISAGYLMHTLDVEDWRFIAGLRYEGTDFKAKGNGIRDGEFEAIDSNNDYDHWLPGLHARYQLDDDTQVRAAWTNTVVRPTFEQMAPGFLIDGDEAEFGNPSLNPLESSNLDFGIEHYLGDAGVASAFVFYKDIQNFVYNTDVAGSGAWVDFDEAITFANGDSADLYGLELAYSQKLSMLPAPWNGVLLGANATFSRSEASINGQGSKRDIDLPFQADSVGNLMLGWENDKLSLRLSANYKSDYLYEVAAVDDQAHDQFVDDQTYVDFTARYFLTDELQLSFEAQNLTDQPYYLYSGNSSYNAQYEEYGPSYKLGVTFTHF
jgi:TonB-dependent receptor